MTTINPKGLTGAAGVPVGATVTATSWHVAHLYGPGTGHPTERAAIAAGLAEAEARVAQYDGRHLPAVERFTIDLRWKMSWQQGSPDANGRSTASCGIEQTVSRVTYDTLADAREHLARIEKYASVG